MFKIALIAAMTPDRIIGKNNLLPWNMPADLAYFKKTTLNKIIIMGRKTFDSISRALPNRRNIVITRDSSFNAEHIEIFYSLESVLEKLKSENLENNTEVFIIGGGEIFKQAISLADKLYITLIHAEIDGDAFFPTWNEKDWKEIFREEHKKDKNNIYDYSFIILEKKLETKAI